MSKFIELTGKATGDEIYFNVSRIETIFKWNDGSIVVTTNCDVTTEEKYIVNESPAEIMAKIQEVQENE